MINHQEIAELQKALLTHSETIHTAILNIDASEVMDENDPEYRCYCIKDYLRDLIWASKRITAICENVKLFKNGGTK